ncbi:class I SAM-dependent methyltransferase [Enterovibrio coralii]|uniref:Ubiquinone/menaquinone biosynthesis protein n=1 Tax=Enterovibrio coralii TaxID=294935 RepID=A0A135IAX8_9GAMM|nr:class I SAM-dependent methyltransferase [Enterovibrio coralii]KXF82611.1 ubiquinone/menaquinone biosynthesis protein [Enterovibrio coralii]
MLLDHKNVLGLLRYPCCGTENKRANLTSEESLTATSHVDDFPILICSEHQSGVGESFSPHTSAIQRVQYNGIFRNLRRLVCPPPFVTRKNVSLLLEQLFAHSDTPRVLIVGGATIGEGMEPFYDDSNIELVSFDIYRTPYVQFIADAHCIPLKDNSFDAVIVQAVLEHVFYPERVIAEVSRVLKPDGLVYAETPFLQQVHEGAYDFTRYTESGHRLLFRHFHLIKSGACSGAGTQLLWALEGFFTGLFRTKYAGKVVKVLLFWIMFFDFIIPESYNIDAANGVYFLGSKSSSLLSESEIISHYKGAQ